MHDVVGRLIAFPRSDRESIEGDAPTQAAPPPDGRSPVEFEAPQINPYIASEMGAGGFEFASAPLEPERESVPERPLSYLEPVHPLELVFPSGP